MRKVIFNLERQLTYLGEPFRQYIGMSRGTHRRKLVPEVVHHCYRGSVHLFTKTFLSNINLRLRQVIQVDLGGLSSSHVVSLYTHSPSGLKTQVEKVGFSENFYFEGGCIF